MTVQLAKAENRKFIRTIEAFCNKHGIAVSTFGRHAVNDGKFVSRIKNGSWIEPETGQRVRDFMERVDRGEVILRGRPRRKKSESRAYAMAELISQETSIRTPGSYAIQEQRHRFHVFAATTNEAWVQADIITDDILKLEVGPPGLRLFYAPMDNGVALARVLRAAHAHYPDLPIQIVIKGWGLEDLRNTLGRMVDRLAEHPRTVLIVTNLYTREAVELRKTADEGPKDLSWREVALSGSRSYDFQQQVAALFGELANEWTVIKGKDDLPVYSRPSVVTIFREDQREALSDLIPEQDDPQTEFDYCFLNHPYLHSHTMTFRTEYVLEPVIQRLAPGGQMKVVQSFGDDPAHEIVRRVWSDKQLKCVSRHDIISALRKSMGADISAYSFSGLTDARSLFRFDMHTLPIIDSNASSAPSLPLQNAWSNAVFFSQVKEELAQEAVREGEKYLLKTAEVLQEHGGLWFVNESFSVSRHPAEKAK